MTDAATRDRGDRLLVVGAGSSGLAAAKNLRERGSEVDVVERSDDVGGNWYFGAPTSRVYASTQMISSKPFTQYPDFPMPDHAPDYLHHSQVLDYLRRYADHFGLREVIEFGASVEHLAPRESATVGTVPDAPRWTATIRNATGTELREYAGVVVCNGHNWYPKIPEYPGQDRFRGEIVHSADHRHAESLRGRRVLVVGAGNTGCDIAVEAAQNAEATFHSTRRGYWYARKYVAGRPTDQFSDLFFSLGLPHRLIQTIFETTVRLTIGDFERHGLKEPDHRILETHPIVNETLVHHVGHGDITPVADIERFETDRVVLADGRAVEVDLVVFCTGYLIRFPFLDEALLNWRDGRPHLYRNVFSPDFPNLAVIGLIQPDSGQFNLVHWQAVALARFLAAQRDAPDIARSFWSHLRDHLGDRSTGGLEFVDSTRHHVEVEHFDYIRDLDHDVNRHLPVGDPEPVMQRLEWTFPAPPVERELLSVAPDSAGGAVRAGVGPGAGGSGGDGSEGGGPGGGGSGGGRSDARPPILFVHGSGHGAWCWEEHWMPAAADAGWPTHAVSLRGHGRSTGRERLSRRTLRHHVHDVLQAITTLPEPPVVVGHSIGALVVQQVLERYPARAGVLVAPVGLRHGARIVGALVRHQPSALLRALTLRSVELDRSLLFSDAAPDDDAERWIERLDPGAPLVQLQAIAPRRPRATKAPVLVLGGGDDPIAPPIEAVRTARHYGTRARLFRGMRHDLMLDAGWEAPLAVLLDWLEDEVGARRLRPHRRRGPRRAGPALRGRTAS